MRHDRELVFDDDPWARIEDAAFMEFRLTYAGPLYSTANDSETKAVKRSDHKHDLRMAFQPQLKRLWEVTPFLKRGHSAGPMDAEIGEWVDGKVLHHTPQELAKRFNMFTWNFVPLVTSGMDLMCAIDVLFLRPGVPGGVLHQGDIDGRLKTLVDALSIPDANQGYQDRKWSSGSNPLYVLLEDDRLVTKVSVETDQMLEFVSPKRDMHEVRLVITVRIRPYEIHAGNMAFG